jgi:hypothetical protein
MGGIKIVAIKAKMSQLKRNVQEDEGLFYIPLFFITLTPQTKE